MLYGCYIYAINSTEKFTENYDEIAGTIVRNGRSVRFNIKTYVKYRKSITFVTFSEWKKFLFEFCYGFVTRSQSLRGKKIFRVAAIIHSTRIYRMLRCREL